MKQNLEFLIWKLIIKVVNTIDSGELSIKIFIISNIIFLFTKTININWWFCNLNLNFKNYL